MSSHQESDGARICATPGHRRPSWYVGGHLTLNQRVQGSNPCTPTNKINDLVSLNASELTLRLHLRLRMGVLRNVRVCYALSGRKVSDVHRHWSMHTREKESHPDSYVTLCPTRMDAMASASLARAKPPARPPRIGHAERVLSAISPTVRVIVVGALSNHGD